MPVYVAEDPLDCVVKGTGKTAEDLEKLKNILINSRKRKQYKNTIKTLIRREGCIEKTK